MVFLLTMRETRLTLVVWEQEEEHLFEEHLFTECGIKLSWFDYAGYPEYSQRGRNFVHHVSIVDLLFNCGKMHLII